MGLGDFKQTRSIAESKEVLDKKLNQEQWDTLATLMEKPGAADKLMKLVKNPPAMLKALLGL